MLYILYVLNIFYLFCIYLIYFVYFVYFLYYVRYDIGGTARPELGEPHGALEAAPPSAVLFVYIFVYFVYINYKYMSSIDPNTFYEHIRTPFRTPIRTPFRTPFRTPSSVQALCALCASAWWQDRK